MGRLRLSDIGEFGLIERIKSILGSEIIGDDTARIEIRNGKALITSDSMVENRHFLPTYPPSAVGWKAVSINVSDIVACGGVPRYMTVSLILRDVELSFVEELYTGIKRACEFYGCQVVGGNISSSEILVIDITMVGEGEVFVSRAGAKPGDGVFVSGTLGDSRAGLELLLEGKEDYEPYELRLIERHLRPTARTDYIKHIQRYANSCIDISDGLSSELLHVARASGVRIDIESSKLPVSEELKVFCNRRNREPLEYVLGGGEDYQLLFTHPEQRWNPFLDMSLIGRVSEGKGVFLDGKEIKAEGFKHF
jgi:thiamine-monophosphate kinase